MKKTTKVIAIIAASVVAIALAACNTTKGLGTDIKSAGSGLEGSAERNGAK
jgi:predicted small secreted protein